MVNIPDQWEKDRASLAEMLIEAYLHLTSKLFVVENGSGSECIAALYAKGNVFAVKVITCSGWNPGKGVVSFTNWMYRKEA